MKKMACFCMALIFFMISSFNIVSFASAQTIDVEKTQLGTTDTYYEFDADTKTLTISGKGATPNMKITDSPWCDYRSDGSIEKVVIEEGITVLGNYLLYQVSASDIQLPSTLTKISNYALSATIGVESWDLPFGLTEISTGAFDRCSTMTSINLPKTLVTIGANAFQSCTSLEKITIPYNVSSILSKAFNGCTNLSEVTFQSLTATVKIGNEAFLGCSSLKNLSVPMNATCGKHFFGYKKSGANYIAYTDVSLNVYPSSPAYIYAESNCSYDMYDSFDMGCGVENRLTYDYDNANDVYGFKFVPDSNVVYNFYSRGDCDVSAVLKDDKGRIIANNDDIDDMTDKNFCISASLKSGSEYELLVSSYMSKSTGDFGVFLYPDVIDSFSVDNALNMIASDGIIKDEYRYFDLTDIAESLILNVKFNNGFSDKMYFKSGYFDKKDMHLIDNQDSVHFYCGKNTAQVAIDNIYAQYNVNVEHAFTDTVFEPTLDNDGYTLHTCVLCSESYKDSFVKTTAVTVSGKAVMMEKRDGSHDHNVAYPYVHFYANDRAYYIDENGDWSFKTFDDCDIEFINEYGENVTIHIDVEGQNLDYGTVAFEGYDFNGDTKVNVKDFVLFRRKYKKGELPESYWDYALAFFRK